MKCHGLLLVLTMAVARARSIAGMILLSHLVLSGVADISSDYKTPCNDDYVKIVNQTGIEAYKNCTILGPGRFLVDHSYTGSFELPGVQNMSSFSVGYLGERLPGSKNPDYGVTKISMPDLKTISYGGMLFGYIDVLETISFP